VNPIKVLDLCLGAHKSISFSRVDGEFRCTTSAGSFSAPDLETLFRDLAYQTADSLSFQARQESAALELKFRTHEALYAELIETIPAPPPVPDLDDLAVFRAEQTLGVHDVPPEYVLDLT
jgi:hypothetical protein